MLLAALVRSGRNEAEFSIPSALVNLVLVQDGIHRAREVYKRYEPSGSFTEACFRTLLVKFCQFKKTLHNFFLSEKKN